MVYVDDIIITENSVSMIQQCISAFASRFPLKDLGQLNYFLSIQVLPCSQGLFFSQHKYMSNHVQEVSTPFSIGVRLKHDDGVPLFDAT